MKSFYVEEGETNHKFEPKFIDDDSAHKDWNPVIVQRMIGSVKPAFNVLSAAFDTDGYLSMQFSQAAPSRTFCMFAIVWYKL